MILAFGTANPPLSKEHNDSFYLVHRDEWSVPRICVYRHNKGSDSDSWARFVEPESGRFVMASASNVRYEPIAWEAK